MLNRLINYFAHNHLLINFIFFITLAGGIYYWTIIGKEALPNVEFEAARITAYYTGASAEDVEIFITQPLEDALKSVEGIQRMTSTSSSGNSRLFVEIENTAKLDTVISDIKTAVQEAKLPSEVKNPPQVRQFKTSQRAVIDIALINTNHHFLDFENRSTLQDYSQSLESRLTSLSAVNSISKTGYLKKLLKIELIPEKLDHFDIPINTVVSKLNNYDLKQPLGTLNDSSESEVVIAETDYSPEELKKIILQGSYLNPQVQLGEISRIYFDFEENSSITKVNGNEAIILNITKNASYGILKAVEDIKKQVEQFRTLNPHVTLVYLDDESVEVANRIALIGNNGIIGFILILVLLFLLLDFTSGFWVAIGIPFTFAFTIMAAHFLGFTINNVTLAGVIIAMGMIVDDAIIVAENIVRKKKEGVILCQAVVEGTSEMFLPITASVITTCIAFMPMYVIEGRFAQLVTPIPAMVTIMLIASLLESLLLLPGHINYTPSPRWQRWFFFKKKTTTSRSSRDWFTLVENGYKIFLGKALNYRYVILILFIGLLGLAGYHLIKNMKFVFFPNEEAREVFLSGKILKSKNQMETAIKTSKVETIIRKYSEEVASFRTDISYNRRGRIVGENEFTIWVELVPKEKREKSLNQLTQEWEEDFKTIPELEISLRRQRFGRASGVGALEIVVLDNNDESRIGAIEFLLEIMNKDPDLKGVEFNKQPVSSGYAVKIKHSLSEIAGVDGKTLVSILRTVLNGQVIEEIQMDNKEIDFIITLPETIKKDISQTIQFPISLKNGNTVPLSQFVETSSLSIPTSIYRERYRRVDKIYADIQDYFVPSQHSQEKRRKHQTLEKRNSLKSETVENSNNSSSKSPKFSKQADTPFLVSQPPEGWKMPTPLQVAERYEQEIFPAINTRYPNTIVYFDGEVKESRESKNDFLVAFVMVLLSIFVILALLFHSLIKPLIVMVIIPFGLAGVVLAFYFHGITDYGFFGLLGFLGLSGVVVNDTIVMLSRFEKHLKAHPKSFHRENFLEKIADTAKTRLRAVIMTTVSTVAGLFPTVYGWAGYDSLLAEMMFVIAWGLIFATLITLILVPSIYAIVIGWRFKRHKNFI